MATILKRRGYRPYVTVERLIAITAVALTAAGFAQPQVLALAGLTFDQPTTVVARATDPMPTGSIRQDDMASSPVHGLAGTLKALRSRN